MNHLGPWHNEDFESLSWQDVHVYAIRFASFKSEEGTADLGLDIDYILKRENSDNGFLFTVCQAELRFHDAFGIKLEIDYATPTAGMCPFSFDGINREKLEFATGFTSYRWRLPINWPRGSLEFDAPAFTLTLIDEPVVQSEQWLGADKRATRR